MVQKVRATKYTLNDRDKVAHLEKKLLVAELKLDVATELRCMCQDDGDWPEMAAEIFRCFEELDAWWAPRARLQLRDWRDEIRKRLQAREALRQELARTRQEQVMFGFNAPMAGRKWE